MQHAYRRAAPCAQGIDQALCQCRAAEYAAVEQHCVRHRQLAIFRQAKRFACGGGVLAQEAGQVTRDGRIAGIRQAEFHDAGARALGVFLVGIEREEAIEHDAFDVFAPQVGLAAGADQAAAGAEQGDGDVAWRIVSQQLFLGCAAAFGELGQACARQAAARGILAGLFGHARLDQVGQRQVHIVAAQDQVVAHADAGERRLAIFRFDLDQAEVGGAAADVGHQHQARLAQVFAQVRAMPVQPVVQRGLRFFQQANIRQAGLFRRLQRQRTRAFVERGGNREHDLLAFEQLFGKAGVPCGAQVGQVAGAGRHRRHLGHITFGAPGQDRRHAVDARVRQPALGAGHQAPRRGRAERACQAAERDVFDAGDI